MYKEDRKNIEETGTAFVLTMMLMNTLIFAVIGGAVWMFYGLIVKADSLNAFIHGCFFP